MKGNEEAIKTNNLSKRTEEKRFKWKNATESGTEPYHPKPLIIASDLMDPSPWPNRAYTSRTTG